MATLQWTASIAKRIDRKLAVMEIESAGHPFSESDAKRLEGFMTEPWFIRWVAGILNDGSKDHGNHYFYNIGNRCLDYYVLTQPPASGSNPESEESNGN